MSLNTHPVRSEQPEVVTIHGYVTGTGAADPTLTEGAGVKSVTRAPTGIYTFSFLDKHVKLIGWHFDFGAATPADVKGFSAAADDLDTTGDNDTLAVSVFDAADAAADLAAAQYMTFTFVFRMTEVTTE